MCEFKKSSDFRTFPGAEEFLASLTPSVGTEMWVEPSEWPDGSLRSKFYSVSDPREQGNKARRDDCHLGVFVTR